MYWDMWGHDKNNYFEDEQSELSSPDEFPRHHTIYETIYDPTYETIYEAIYDYMRYLYDFCAFLWQNILPKDR